MNFTTFIIITHTCRRCNKKFQFNNKLYKHFKKCIAKKISVLHIAKIENFIIDFKTSSNVNIEYNFRFWRYVKLLTFLIKNELFQKYCVDNDITMSLTNKNYIKNIISNIIEHKIFEFLRIKNINFVWHNTFNYVLLNFYVFDVTKNDKFVTIHFQYEIYLIDQLSIKIFIDIVIMMFEQMILNVEKQKLTIKNCDVTIDLNMKIKNFCIDRMIRTF